MAFGKYEDVVMIVKEVIRNLVYRMDIWKCIIIRI